MTASRFPLTQTLFNRLSNLLGQRFKCVREGCEEPFKVGDILIVRRRQTADDDEEPGRCSIYYHEACANLVGIEGRERKRVSPIRI